jgi:DNA polymerase III subunit epsilon
MKRALPTFTAIDFETANHDPESACAIGLVRVEGGRITQRFTKLILFTYLHGIAWHDVAKAPTFGMIWHHVQRLVAGVDFVAAHNAPFDERVLRACCRRVRLPAPNVRFECTVELARRVWRIFPTRLECVTAALGIPLRHHDAASDAEACAQIVLRAKDLR